METRLGDRSKPRLSAKQVSVVMLCASVLAIAALATLYSAPMSMPTSPTGGGALSSFGTRRGLAAAGMVSVAAVGMATIVVSAVSASKRRAALTLGVSLVVLLSAGFGVAAIGHGV